MKRWVSAFGVAAILLTPKTYCAQGEKGTAKSCVILKRMGPADQVTSHLYSFGIRGKQFQYLEGELPQGTKFHGRLTDHDVRLIQDHGGKVVVVDAHYTDQELEEARKSCSTSATTSPGGPAGTGPTAVGPDSPAPAQTQSAAQSTDERLATVALNSTPGGADITVDGKFVGNTPSTVRLKAGDHEIKIEKAGFKAWQRTMTVAAGGNANVDATLERTQ